VQEGSAASRGYTGGFGSALMHKDVGLALDAARDSGATVPLGSLSHEVYSEMLEKGYALKDFSSAYEFLQEESKWSK
jgi:3-hydroxyisobutyrate dehydrogenase